MRMSCILLGPVRITRGRMALVLRHFVTLLRERRVRRVGGTRRGYGGIYRYVGVRLYMWCIMMVILVSILQGHGRTCCLSHTDCTGVSLLQCVWLISRNYTQYSPGVGRAVDGSTPSSSFEMACMIRLRAPVAVDIAVQMDLMQREYV